MESDIHNTVALRNGIPYWQYDTYSDLSLVIYELRAGEYILLFLCKIVLYGHISYVIVVLKNTRGMQIGVELGKIVG